MLFLDKVVREASRRRMLMKDGVMRLSGGKVFQTQKQHERDVSRVGGTTESSMTVAARARRRVVGEEV